MNAELVLDCHNEHGEGIFWNPEDGCIWWTDLMGESIWSLNPETGLSNQHPTNGRVCAFAPRSTGGLIVAFADRISLLEPNNSDEQKIHDFEPHNPNTRSNDGRTDRQGRLILGGMNDVTGDADTSVVRVNHDLSVSTLFYGVSCANSICFSPDGEAMYFADTPDREVIAFDYDTHTGSVSNKRVHCSFRNEPGLPDGSCVDAEGGVWNAEWQGRRVVRISPNGNIDQVIDVPVWKPTCCAFGGPDLDTLFITTSCLYSDEETLANEPTSGGLFAAKPGVRGVLDTPFCG